MSWMLVVAVAWALFAVPVALLIGWGFRRAAPSAALDWDDDLHRLTRQATATPAPLA